MDHGRDLTERPLLARRRFLASAGAGWIAGASCCLAGEADKPAPACADGERILEPSANIDVGGKGEEIIRRAGELGHQYQKKYGGCAQCIVAAIQDAVPFVGVDKGLFRAACALDGGATPNRIQNCGAFSGSGMVISYLCGRTRDGEEFRGSRDPAHRVFRKVYDRFNEQYGSILCKDVREKAEQDCPTVVRRAAEWTVEAILLEFTNYSVHPAR